jgi:hypothetical protein
MGDLARLPQDGGHKAGRGRTPASRVTNLSGQNT